jgi:uncharacterized protein
MSSKLTALVTGASSGIGTELAREHAKRGGDLVLVARRRDRLEALQRELEAAHGVRVSIFDRDLALPDAAESLVRELEDAGLRIDVLINNAGFGGHGKFHQRDWADDKQMIQLNIMTLAALTRLLLPAMIARRSGHVLNVASVAGFLPGPLQATYYATKAFVLTLSEALSNELKGAGVTVTVLCPGATQTEFESRANLGGTRLFVAGVAPASAVAACGYAAMLKGKSLAIPGLSNKFMARVLIPLTPRPLVTWISRQVMEKT